MISISEGIERDRQLVQSYIKQDIELSSEGINGLIAYFGANYEGNKLQLYIKDEEAYLHIDRKDSNYIRTLVIYNRDTGKLYSIKHMKNAPKPVVDLKQTIQ